MKVITTIGISILTQNFAASTYSNSANELLDQWNNNRVQEEIDHFREENTLSNRIFNKNAQEVCAEIHTLYEIAKENPNQTLEVYLLTTDTVTAAIAAELIIAWLNFKKNDDDKTAQRIQIANADFFKTNAELKQMREQRSIYQSAYPDAFILPIPDLQVKNPGAFHANGFSNLLTAIKAIAGADKPILNISGGYKAVIPTLTIMGQLYGYPLRYTHQDNKEGQLIGIEKLPIAFDYSIFEDNYVAFELIKPDKLPHNLPTHEEFKSNLVEEADFDLIDKSGLIMEIMTEPTQTKRIGLSALGKLLFNTYHDEMRDNELDIGNLIGKVMELKVFQFFRDKFPNHNVLLEKAIGQAPDGQAYDADVWVENDELVLAIEVKPEGVKILRTGDNIQTKCEQGAFNASVEYATNTKKQLKCIVAMYHHRQPNRFQEAAFQQLKQMNIPACAHLVWLWVKPPENYKHNVNWKITNDRVKQYDFNQNNWTPFDIHRILAD